MSTLFPGTTITILPFKKTFPEESCELAQKIIF